MTSKKRARNRNKKAAAAAGQVAEIERRPPMAMATASANRPHQPQLQAEIEPHEADSLQEQQLQTADCFPLRKDETKEDTDICVHGLNLQYTNESLKKFLKDLCDDVVSADFDHVQSVLIGHIPQSVLSLQEPYTALMDERCKRLSSLAEQEEISEEVVLDGSGLMFTLLVKFPEIFEEAGHLKWIISHFVSEGTKCLLRGEVQTARGNAYFANFFEQTLAVMTEGKMINTPKLTKLWYSDEHTLCSYFRNRIPCNCLQKIYKEVKSVTKTDMCWNIECTQPNRYEVDSRSMMFCSHCRQACYCSSECQEMDWPTRHKINCGLCSDMKDAFESQSMDALVNNPLWTRTVAPLL